MIHWRQVGHKLLWAGEESNVFVFWTPTQTLHDADCAKIIPIPHSNSTPRQNHAFSDIARQNMVPKASSSSSQIFEPSIKVWQYVT